MADDLDVATTESKFGGLPLQTPMVQSLSFRSKPHVTPEDWHRHKGRITELYVTEKKTLTEVRKTMEAECGFSAS